MSALRSYLFGVVSALVIGGLIALTFWLFVPDLLLHPAAGTTQAAYAHLAPGPVTFLFIFFSEAVCSTLGEELFFRGLLGGWLLKQCGFVLGNTIQALLFVLPHLLLSLLASPRYWLVLPVDLLAGWALGWLPFRSGSICPHAIGRIPGLTCLGEDAWTRTIPSHSDRWTASPRQAFRSTCSLAHRRRTV
jgi:membrane protease YdiL (CAAX protease family)